MKILIVGHACSPGLGSEPGGTWNWAESLSRLGHRVWVICHPEYRSRIEAYFEAHPEASLSLDVIFVNLKRLDPWNPVQGERGLRWHYLFWLGAAYREAERLNRHVRFDVVHHVSLGTVATGSPFWRLDIPFIWGPVGGGQLAPRGFEGYCRDSWMRRLRVDCLRFLPGVRSTARNADLCLATNNETLQVLGEAGARRSGLFLDGGTESRPYHESKSREPGELKLLWAGRLEERKALPLALEALAQCGDVPVRLRVAGDGPLKREWMELSERLDLGPARVEFLGRVAPENMGKLFRLSDAFIFTSLRDSFGTVVLEAMAHSLPVVTLHHQGVGTFLPEDAAIKVPVLHPGQTVMELASAIRRLEGDRSLVCAMGRAAWEWAEKNSWGNRAVAMTGRYEEVIRKL